MKNPFKNNLNIFTKLTLLSTFGVILFLYLSSLIINSDTSGNVTPTLNILGNLPLSYYLFPIFYKGSFVFLFLTPIFGIIATYKTYKQRKMEATIIIVLSIITIAIIYGNFLL